MMPAFILIISLILVTCLGMLYYGLREACHEIYLLNERHDSMQKDLKTAFTLLTETAHRNDCLELKRQYSALFEKMENEIRCCHDNVEDISRICTTKLSTCFTMDQAMPIFQQVVGGVRTQLDDLARSVREDKISYLHRDNLQVELEKYYEDVEKRIKAAKEEVWKNREKAFSIQ